MQSARAYDSPDPGDGDDWGAATVHDGPRAYAARPAGGDEWSAPTLHGGAPDVDASPSHDDAPRRRGRDGGDARGGHLPYAAGLDGVRALAVAAVVVFHLGATWLGGGFLGVDVFFVLSGFLITSILLREFTATGRIDIRTFYLRRARRLLPALFVMLAVVTALTWLVARDQLYRLRGDVITALTYSTNWLQIIWNRGYFDQLGRPSLLQHLWSLAVEEQFYLIWPVVLVLCLAARRPSTRLVVPAAGATLSLLLMAALYHPGEDPARVYYGTDTHVSLMLIGAVLAVVVARPTSWGRTRAGSGVAADAAALVGIVGLVWAATHVSYFSSGLYRGGYLLVAVAACAVIHAASRSGTLTARLFGTPALVWVGQRSYAIYLWHWPILQLWRPGVDTTWPTPLVVGLQLAATVVAADLSYRYVERPIRTHGLRAALHGVDRTQRAQRPRRTGLASAALVGGLALAVAVLALAPSSAPAGIQVDRTHQRATVNVSTANATFATPVRVSFFGDSQGMTLLINRPQGLRKAMTLSDSTVEGCGVLLGTITSRTGYTRNLSADCGSWPQQWRANAARHKPQIAVVEIGAWDVFDVTVGGRKLAFGSRAWNAYFSRQLAEGIGILTRSGAQVALMGVPCYQPIAAGGLPRLPERGDNSRTRHLNVLLRAAAAQNPKRVFVINPPSAFCTDPKIEGNTAYRWDGTHYYIPGAALVFKTITPQLLRIPRPPRR